jgi:hypothetical protein
MGRFDTVGHFTPFSLETSLLSHEKSPRYQLIFILYLVE